MSGVKKMPASFLPRMAFIAVALPAYAQTNHFVWTGGGDTSPFTNWATAAHDIQPAIDAAANGDIIWVTNGVYDTGGTNGYPVPARTLTNRVAIYKAVTVSSVNGPSHTSIAGRWNNPLGDPANTNDVYGDAAVRCVYMAADSMLIGFTLANGATRQDTSQADGMCGGVLGAGSDAVSVSNCVISGNRSFTHGAGAYSVTLYNSTLAGNTAIGSQFTSSGGGARYSILHNCLVSGNSSTGSGGGLRNCVAHHSAIVGNRASDGGGLYDGCLSNCWITGNTANYPGGVSAATAYNCFIAQNTSTGGAGAGAGGSVLYNCDLTGNVGWWGGGGAYNSTLYNCLVVGNALATGSGDGGGARNCELYNCTVAFNSARRNAGGTHEGTAWNSVVYSNHSGAGVADFLNYSNTVFSHSCTFPHPGDAGNMTDDPGFVDSGAGYGTNHISGDYRLPRRSPCIDKGMNLDYMTNPSILATNEWLGKDRDGNTRIRHKAVDIGAYETRISRGALFSAE